MDNKGLQKAIAAPQRCKFRGFRFHRPSIHGTKLTTKVREDDFSSSLKGNKVATIDVGTRVIKKCGKQSCLQGLFGKNTDGP